MESWNGMQWNEIMESWNGMEWNGMEWNGIMESWNHRITESKKIEMVFRTSWQ